MFKILFALIFSTLAFAEIYDINDSNLTDESNISQVNEEIIEQKVLYINYDSIPKRVIKGEIFSVTLKTFCVLKEIDDINYSFSNSKSLEILNDALPQRDFGHNYYKDTFYFKVTGNNVKLPDITATVIDSTTNVYQPAFLKGEKIETVVLNPKDNFCNIVAKDLKIIKFKTTSYDDKHNIVVFQAEAQNSFLKDFHLNNVLSQGFESLSDSIESSKMIYYAVINKKEDNLLFSYFNTLKNDYITLNIPIIVDDDKVTTQSDLKPKDQSKQKLKMFIAIGVVAFGVIMLLWRKRYFYMVFIFIPAIYIIYLLLPQEKVCIKENAKITILPLHNSTVFEITNQEKTFNKIGKTKGFIKIELQNKKIGWVKDEDICSH